MISIAFTADRTIPGLSASDLVRRASDGLSGFLSGFGREARSARREAEIANEIARDLKGLDAHQLRDIGLLQ